MDFIDRFLLWFMDTGPERLMSLPSRARRRIRPHAPIILTALAVVAVFYAVLLVSAFRIRSTAVSYLKQAVGGEVAVGRVNVTPTLRIVIRDVKISSPESRLKIPDFTVGKLTIAADIPSLLRGAVKLREVRLDGVVVTIYKEPDGPYNLSRWIGRMSDCDAASVRAAMPDRVTVRGARVMMEPPPGADWVDTLEIARLDGAAGRTPENNIGVDLTATVFDSPVKIEGGMTPCSPEDFLFTGKSDEFNFSGLRDTVEQVFFESRRPFKLPGGTGRLSIGLAGAVDSPSVQGSVSLRDFDGSFSLSNRTLSLTNFRAGTSAEKISGTGTVDILKAELPFSVTIYMEALNLQRILRDVTGFEYAPRGLLSGYAKLTGQLSDFKAEWSNGNITITDGVLILPDPGLGRSKAGERVEIPITSLTAQLATINGRLGLLNVSIVSDTFKARGSGALGGIHGLDFFAPGATYELDLNFSVDSAAGAAAFFPSLHGLVGGELEGSISLRGAFKRAGDLSGGGVIRLRKGFISNPLSGSYGVPYETVDFELAEAKYEIGRDSMRIVSSSVSGNGLFIDAAGEIAYDGTLNISGGAELSADWASRFAGIGQYINVVDLNSMTMYRAKFTLRGPMRSPEQKWEQPQVTRWK